MEANTKTKHVGRGGPRRGSGRPARTVVLRVFAPKPQGSKGWKDRLVTTVAKADLGATWATVDGDPRAVDFKVDHRKAAAVFAVLRTVDAKAQVQGA